MAALKFLYQRKLLNNIRYIVCYWYGANVAQKNVTEHDGASGAYIPTTG